MRTARNQPIIYSYIENYTMYMFESFEYQLSSKTNRRKKISYNNLHWNKANIVKLEGRKMRTCTSIPKLIFNKKLWHLNGYKYGIFSSSFLGFFPSFVSFRSFHPFAHSFVRSFVRSLVHSLGSLQSGSILKH